MKLNILNKPYSRRNIFKIYLSLSFLVCFGWLVLGQNNKALALWDTTTTISNTAPLPNSANLYRDKNQTPANYVGSRTPSFVVGDGIFDGNYAWMKFYIPIGQPATVTIQNGGGFCSRTTPVNDMMDANTLSGAIAENPHVKYSLYDLDSSESEISPLGSTFFSGLDSLDASTGGATCRNLSFNAIPATAGVPSAVYGHTGYRVFAFLAHIVNCPDDDKQCVHDIVKEFRLSTSAGLVGTSRAINSLTDAGSPFGVVYDTPPNNYTWNYTFQFAPRCNERNPNSTMHVYDMDNAILTTQQPNANLYYDDKTTGGPIPNWILQQHFDTAALGPPVDHSDAIINYSTDPNHRMRFDFIDIAQWNRIEDYTGYDQFDAADFVCYNATCTAQILDPASGTQEAGKDVQIRVQTKNTGVAPWLDKFYLGDTTGRDSDKHYVSPSPVPEGGTATFTFVVSEDTAGTYTYNYQMHEDNDNAFGAICPVTLTFTQGNGPIVVGCDETRVSGVRSSASGNVQARLSFTRTKGTDGPGTFDFDWSFLNDGADHTFNTFNTIPNDELFPHQPYSIDFLVKNSNGNYQKRATVKLGQCLSVSCFGSIGGADVEPGQSTEITYGVTVVNNTTEGFNGYNLHLNSDGGITGVPSSPIIAILESGTPGRSTDVDQPFNATINYEGTLQADFYFNDTNLAGVYDSLPCVDKATPKTRPFLKVVQGDVSTGGSFAQYDAASGLASCPNVGTPGYVSPTGGNLYLGGIRTFSTPDAKKGSSADFAAYALGLIDGDESGPDGFYSSDINGGGENNINTLSFANKGVDDVGALGGLLGGSTPSQTAHCMPELFNSTRDPKLAVTTDPGDIGLSSTLTSRQYYYRTSDGSPIVITGGNINPGVQATIYVQGDVYITGNINFPGNWEPGRIPYFALIVEGNITVAPNVTDLAGLYVAQPLSDASGNVSKGVFQTCSIDGGTDVTASQITDDCRKNDFTLNGAVMARRVSPIRSDSTMWNGSQAETFYFTPSMVLGNPNFNSTTGAVIPFTLQSLQSLPPVF